MRTVTHAVLIVAAKTATPDHGLEPELAPGKPRPQPVTSQPDRVRLARLRTLLRVPEKR